MKPIKPFLAAVGLFSMIALPGFAQDAADQVVASLQSQGFTRIEITNGLGQTKIEGIRGTDKVEVVVDTTSGEVLKSEQERATIFDSRAPGVFERDRNRTFVSGSDDDDRDRQERERDRERDRDREGWDDDDHGRDHGPDHDSDDDHESDHDDDHDEDHDSGDDGDHDSGHGDSYDD